MKTQGPWGLILILTLLAALSGTKESFGASEWVSTADSLGSNPVGAAAQGTVYISDHFDGQDDWVGKNGSCNDPPSPWDSYGYYCSGRIHIDSTDDAHGSGKCMWIEWGQAMKEWALMTFAVEGTTEFWTGFWWRHDAGWDWGSDTTYKWFYGPQSAGDRWMVNYDKGHRFVIHGDVVQGDVAFDVDDDSWRYYIIYAKHNTPGSSDGEIRLWVDGNEVNWHYRYGDQDPYPNRAIMFSDTTSAWESFIAFGFQSRPGWGSGNTVYYDDITVADNRKDVESFLGIAEPEPPDLVLSGAPADQAIHLSWTVNTTLPLTTTWQIGYDGPAGDQPSPISGIISPTRAYTLTGLTNYTLYTVTLNGTLDSTPFLTDTVKVMPTDISVYLPLVLRAYGL